MVQNAVAEPDACHTPIPRGRGRNWPNTQREIDQILIQKEQDLSGTEGTVPSATTVSSNFGDHAQSEELVQDQARTLEAQDSALARVQAARARIRCGTFGVCAKCEANIPVKRLLAIPETTLCIRCAQKRERKMMARTLGGNDAGDFGLATEYEDAQQAGKEPEEE